MSFSDISCTPKAPWKSKLEALGLDAMRRPKMFSLPSQLANWRVDGRRNQEAPICQSARVGYQAHVPGLGRRAALPETRHLTEEQLFAI